MKKIFAMLVFITIETVLLPITLIGAVWYWIKLILPSRRNGISATAYDPLLVRWMLHKSGAREDEACHRLLMSLPATSPLTLQMMLGPTFLAMRLSGIKLSIVTYPVARPSTLMNLVNHRTEFFDKAIPPLFDSRQRRSIALRLVQKLGGLPAIVAWQKEMFF